MLSSDLNGNPGKTPRLLIGGGAAAVLAVTSIVLLGPGLLGLAVAAPVAAVAFAAGYKAPDLRRKRRPAQQAAQPNGGFRPITATERPDPAILQDIQRMIDQFDRVQAQIPTPEGKAMIWKAIESSQLVLERLQQPATPASQARRVHNKLKSYSLILTHYESLANGKLLTADEAFRDDMLEKIESDALSRIANQLELFARSMDEDEIMELEVELEMLRRLG